MFITTLKDPTDVVGLCILFNSDFRIGIIKMIGKRITKSSNYASTNKYIYYDQKASGNCK